MKGKIGNRPTPCLGSFLDRNMPLVTAWLMKKFWKTVDLKIEGCPYHPAIRQ